MRAFLLITAAVALAGCATTSAPLPQPVTNIDARTCQTSVDVTKPISLTPERPEQSFAVTTTVDSTFPCVEMDGVKAAYVVYAMPPEPTFKTLTVGGVFEALRIFAPIVQTLDENGAVVRTFAGDDFLVRGSVYSTQLRPRAEEKFVLVRSAAGLAGERDTQTRMGINTTATYVAGVGAVTFNTGAENTATRTFSHEGIVSVSWADPRPPAPREPRKKRQ